MARLGWRRALTGAALLTMAGVIGGAAYEETLSFRLEARVFSLLGSHMDWNLRDGADLAPLKAGDGPYDRRLGYTYIRDYVASLERNQYTVEVQAVTSPEMRAYMAAGGFAPYHEKDQAGLLLRDRDGNPLHEARYPERVFEKFDDIPHLVTDTLLFIENRWLLDDTVARRNPAIEWARFLGAMATLPLQWIEPGRRNPGGSTLATQIEKYRHSPEGRTDGVIEKLRQMVSASVRAYLDGEDTTEARRRILVEYLNSTPLSARPGFGEVLGIGDGLWVWFGTDLPTLRATLDGPMRTVGDLQRKALVYKQVLALILAQRRPSTYLLTDRPALEALTDAHLRVLADAGVIDTDLRDWALLQPLRFRDDVPSPQVTSFIQQKAPNALRNKLLAMLGVPGLYELDRLDLTVDSTLDGSTQERVVQTLRHLNDPAFARSLGLYGKTLLDADGGDVSKLVYSFTLYERGSDANYLRVQADNLDQPLDINDGAKLDLGSTAKLRTLVAYFQIVSELHARYGALSRDVLDDIHDEADDPLSRWATEWLATASDRSLPAMLDAAIERKYSASPAETFFTGGGVHAFVNFDHTFDHSVVPLSMALRYSINLPFVRLMRDIVSYLTAETNDDAPGILENQDHPARQTYLARFADQDGIEFLNRFYAVYRRLSPDEMLERLARRTQVPARLAVIYRTLRPEASQDDFGVFLRDHLAAGSAKAAITEAQMAALYARYAPGRYSLNDLGYIARVHPLELWLAGWLPRNPDADRRAMIAASTEIRQQSYAWLFAGKRAAQNTRIRISLEQEAFKRLHAMWRAVGYPFDQLVPSLATAIGSSADRPAALAELMGIILNDGIRLPTERITKLHFAAATPYETMVGLGLQKGQRVLSPEICAAIRRALADVVANGTARRVAGAFIGDDGRPLAIGGKTGTGDDRYEHFAANGAVTDSRAVARTATFVFYLGDRFFGTMTAFVQGEDADRYHFTSALPAQLLKALVPALEPLVGAAAPHTAETEN